MRLCSPQLGLSASSILGGEIYDRQILAYLAKLGVQIEIILPRAKPVQSVNGWQVHNTWFPFVYPPHLYNLLVLPYLFQVYRKTKFEILRIHSPTFIGLAGILFKKLNPNVPVVGVYHWLGEGGLLGEILDPLLVNYFDAIICDSFYTKAQLIMKYPQIQQKIYAVHNGIDENLYPTRKSRNLLHKYQIRKSSITLLYMGLFIERKNPLFLLPLIRQLIGKKIPLYLIYCGSGPLENILRKKIVNYRLEKQVKIIAPVFGVEKNELMNSADIFVHPAVNEGFSLAVIEAMACGLPVVINEGYSASEAVTNGQNGFVCRNSNEWFSRLQLLCQILELRKTFGQNNIKKVKAEFQWSIAAKKQFSIFHDLLRSKTAR